jgi:hypothetical protein
VTEDIFQKGKGKEDVMKAKNNETAQMGIGAVISRLSDEQIELVANIFSKGNEHLLADMEVEWLLSHAFQLGAKFHRDFTKKDK